MTKLLFFNIPATGHINPTLAVVSELVRRGTEVVYANTDESRILIEATGARFVAYPALPEIEDVIAKAGGGNLTDNMLALIAICERVLPWTMETIQLEKPDLIVFDSLCSWARLAAERLRARAAASITTFAFTREAGMTMPPATLVRLMFDLVVRTPPYMRIARRMQREQGIRPPFLPGAVMNTGTFNLVYTSRAFQPGGDKFGDDYTFVGPSIAPRPNAPDFPYEQLTGLPLVYISLGTINNQNAGFYQQCFEAFGDSNVQVVMSVGKAMDIAALGVIPANFIVRNQVPQLEILQRAHLFITHGGLNSVHEGLYYGVPLVVIPQQFEQASVAQQVVSCGAGVALGASPPFGVVTVAALRESVDTLLTARHYREAAQALGDTLREAGGYVRAADVLLAYAMREG